MKTQAKGKLFGIFNIVDVAIMILIIAVVCAGLFLLRSRDKVVASGGMKEISYTVEGQNVLKNAADLPKKGDKVYNSSTSDYLGEVKDIVVEEQTRVDYNPVKGVYERHVIPNRHTIYLTIVGEGFDTDQNITVNDAVVKVGAEINVKGKGYAFGGYIVKIELGEANN